MPSAPRAHVARLGRQFPAATQAVDQRRVGLIFATQLFSKSGSARQLELILSRIPLPPMRWPYPYLCSVRSVNPATENATAGKDKRMGSIEIDDSQFQISVKGSGFNLEPCHVIQLAALTGRGI